MMVANYRGIYFLGVRVCVCEWVKMFCVPIKIFWLISIKPTAVEHFLMKKMVVRWLEKNMWRLWYWSGKGKAWLLVTLNLAENTGESCVSLSFLMCEIGIVLAQSFSQNQMRSCVERALQNHRASHKCKGLIKRFRMRKTNTEKVIESKSFPERFSFLGFIWSQQFPVLIFLVWSVCLTNWYFTKTTISTWKVRTSDFLSLIGSSQGLPLSQADLKLRFFSIRTEAPWS